MSLTDAIIALASAIGADIKSLFTKNTVTGRMSSCNVGGYISGVYYDNGIMAAPGASAAVDPNLLAAVPFMTPVALTIDRLGIVVATLASGGSMDIHIYDSTAAGWPGAKLLSTGSLPTTSIGLKEQAVSFTFEAGKQYWLAVRCNAAFSLRAMQIYAVKTIGILSTDGSGLSYATALVVSSTFSGAVPSTWGTVTAAQFSAFNSPSFRMRAA